MAEAGARLAHDEHRLRRRLIGAVLVTAAIVALGLALPPLRRVAHTIAHMRAGWLLLALALEVGSNLGFVVIFRLFFERVPVFERVPAATPWELAWTEVGSSALLPGGRVGALAVGGWLLHGAGVSTHRIVERSSGLFFLTSATNAAALFLGGLLLTAGIGSGPHDFPRAVLPVIIAPIGVATVLALPALASSGWIRGAWLRDLLCGIRDARRTLARPSRRLAAHPLRRRATHRRTTCAARQCPLQNLIAATKEVFVMQANQPVTLRPGKHTLDSGSGSLQVLTYREGMAQKVGHDLIIDVGQWEAVLEVDQHGAPTAIALEVDARSLRVREGLHGVKPLTEKDRASIHHDIEEKILRGQRVSFHSTSVERRGHTLAVQGTLTIVGMERPASFQLNLAGDGRLTGRLPVTQSEWGIRPYRAFMGALKVRDTVEVTLDVRLPR